MSISISPEVIGKFREGLVGMLKSPIQKSIVEPKDQVLARFQPIFSPDHIPSITDDEFKSFLILENNRHWTGLHRQGPRMCASMKKLRQSLSLLVDDNRHIAQRLDEAVELVDGMGKNVATGILIVMFPEKYGVWNSRSEGGLKKHGIWPSFERGESFGKRYVKVNEVLLRLCEELGTDLWTLDSLWYFLDLQEEGNVPEAAAGEELVDMEQSFGLERHLHEFMRDNWSRLELGKHWELYREPGDDEAGYEYPCDIGRIDLLAKHKTEPRWLVVELKRSQSSDQTVGQLLRYIGWVKQHKASKKDQVHGMIVCREPEKTLYYALSSVPNVEVRVYKVDFHLEKPSNPTLND